MRLVAIVCVQDQGPKKEDFRLLYYFDKGDGKLIKRIRKVGRRSMRTKSIIREHPVADLFEREIHDYYGVEFEGNPNLHVPLFLPEEEKNKHPLLKGEKNA